MKLFRYIQKCNSLIFCVLKGASTHIKNHNAITKERNQHITETVQSVEERPPPPSLLSNLLYTISSSISLWKFLCHTTPRHQNHFSNTIEGLLDKTLVFPYNKRGLAEGATTVLLMGLIGELLVPGPYNWDVRLLSLILSVEIAS